MHYAVALAVKNDVLLNSKISLKIARLVSYIQRGVDHRYTTTELLFDPVEKLFELRYPG